MSNGISNGHITIKFVCIPKTASAAVAPISAAREPTKFAPVRSLWSLVNDEHVAIDSLLNLSTAKIAEVDAAPAFEFVAPRSLVKPTASLRPMIYASRDVSHVRWTKSQRTEVSVFMRPLLEHLEDGTSTIAEVQASLKYRFPHLAYRFTESFILRARRGAVLQIHSSHSRAKSATVPVEPPTASKDVNYNSEWEDSVICDVVAGIAGDRLFSQIAAEAGIPRSTVSKIVDQIQSGTIKPNGPHSTFYKAHSKLQNLKKSIKRQI